MAITVIRIDPGGGNAVVEVGDGGPTFKEAIGANWITSERLTPPDKDPAGDDLVLWYDEEGADNGSEPNPKAGKLAEMVTGAQRALLGAVLVTGLPDANGDTRGLTPQQVADVSTMLAGAVA